MNTVAVIIPFYQREHGSLTRALDSVAAQSHQDWRVIIVDDSSPLPADAEVAARPDWQRERITLVRQPNGGPGAARNSGLDEVPPSTPYIAFLDSDDRWASGHLETAVSALREGYDFFFADYSWPRGTQTRFEQTGLDRRTEPITPGSTVHAYSDDFFEAVLSFWPVHLSATVIDAKTLGNLRFNERLRYSSEDMHYFLQCACATSRICYGMEIGVRFDRGMKFYSQQPVGSFEFSRSRLTNAYFHRLIEAEAAKRSGAVRDLNRRLLKRNYYDFVRSESKALLFHRCLHLNLYGDLLSIMRGALKPPGFTFGQAMAEQAATRAGARSDT